MSQAIPSQCGTCQQVFASVKAFDFHRVGAHEYQERRCLTPREMRRMGMSQDAQLRWMLPMPTSSMTVCQKSKGTKPMRKTLSTKRNTYTRASRPA